MPTKKKSSAKNARELASPRVSRPPKKASENVQIEGKKVADLITSSARKQKLGGTAQNPRREPIAAKKLNSGYVLTLDETQDVYLEKDAVDEPCHKECNLGTTEPISETIFSPGFHSPKEDGHAVDFIKYFKKEDEKDIQERRFEEPQEGHITMEATVSVGKYEQKAYCENSRLAVPTISSSQMDVDTNISADQKTNPETNLYSEVSAIYLSVQHSKLECVDEPSQDSTSSEVCVDVDDVEEYDYFNPYFFIKNLPNLSSVVPTFRSTLLPKQTRSCPSTTLVLDLDETLVHSTLEPCDDVDFTFPVNFNLMKHTVYVKCRPHLKDFLERVASLFEIIIFTASQSIYAEQLLNVLDPKRRLFRHRVYRDSCVFVDGNYVKDLSILGRDMSRVVIIDNSPQAFGFQVDNGIPIESWFDDRSDEELLLLLPFLESLVGVEDVRPLVANKFNLREKVNSAAYPSLNLNFLDHYGR